MSFQMIPRPVPVTEGYPCPDCLHTWLPGQTITLTNPPRPSDPRTHGTGKIWDYHTTAVASLGPSPPPTLVDCWRCQGTGYVADRRKTQSTRRLGLIAVTEGRSLSSAALEPTPDPPGSVGHFIGAFRNRLKADIRAKELVEWKLNEDVNSFTLTVRWKRQAGG